MKTEHLSPQDQAIENAILKRVLIVATCILSITIIGIFYAQNVKHDQDKRTEYIESGHSEIK